jgi:hypothetical protein
MRTRAVSDRCHWCRHSFHLGSGNPPKLSLLGSGNKLTTQWCKPVREITPLQVCLSHQHVALLSVHKVPYKAENNGKQLWQAGAPSPTAKMSMKPTHTMLSWKTAPRQACSHGELA